ncbi:MAG: DoxX family membrane protein [Conexivisphaerales archaeon]
MTSIFPSSLPYAGDASLLLRVVVGVSLVMHGRTELGGGTQQAVQWIEGMGYSASGPLVGL